MLCLCGAFNDAVVFESEHGKGFHRSGVVDSQSITQENQIDPATLCHLANWNIWAERVPVRVRMKVEPIFSED